MARSLVIDDDADFGESLKSALADYGHTAKYVENAREGLELLSQGVFDVVLLDNRMPGMTGIEFLKVLQERDVDVPVILMTHQGSSETVIEAINLGAFDYVAKPLELDVLIDELDPLIRKAQRLSPAGTRTHEIREESPGQPRLLGTSKPMVELYKQIGSVAKTALPVLIRGETGTGKELVARAVHDFSPRRERPFVALNCTALNENLLDDELFGHVEGAFSGADKLRKGRFEYADTGTLFLDEVGDMPPPLQAKLLRVLENHEVVRIGSNETIEVDVRIVSATHQDLEAAAQEGRFREDLLYRLNGMTLSIPPLRERGADLELLVRHFVAVESANANRPAPMVEEAALKRLRAYPWPGNVRELQFVTRRAVQSCHGATILPEHFNLPTPAAAGDHDPDGLLRKSVEWAWHSGRPELSQLLNEMLERQLIAYALDQCEGNQTQVAQRLGISRNYLRKRIQELGLG